MEIIVFLLLVWLFARIFPKKRKGPVDKWEAFEEAARKNEKQQRRYDDYMMSLPELMGDGTYSQKIRGELAYRETLDNFGEWMERYHPGEDEINVIVERIVSKDGKEHSVRIEAGNAVIGFIPREIAGEFGNELKNLGGVARASAKFKWSPHNGQSSISLDVVRPLRTL
jgi:hypothetical protein